jgi:hypothetical protein
MQLYSAVDKCIYVHHKNLAKVTLVALRYCITTVPSLIYGTCIQQYSHILTLSYNLSLSLSLYMNETYEYTLCTPHRRTLYSMYSIHNL